MGAFLLKKNGGKDFSSYDIYLISGSLAVFLFLLLPISFIYIADFNLILLIMILGFIFLIYFLISVLGIFDKEVNNKNSKEIKFQSNLSNSEFKRGENSNFNVHFARSVKDFSEEDNDDDQLYSLNMSKDDFFK